MGFSLILRTFLAGLLISLFSAQGAFGVDLNMIKPDCIYASSSLASLWSLQNQCDYLKGEIAQFKAQLDTARKSEAEVARKLPEIYRRQLEQQDKEFQATLNQEIAAGALISAGALRGAGGVEGGPVRYDENSFVVREPSGTPARSDHGLQPGDISEAERNEFQGMARDFAELQTKWIDHELGKHQHQFHACGCPEALKLPRKR